VPSQIHSPISVYKIPKQPFYYHRDPLLGWGNRTTSIVETQIIPHGRHRLLLREPYVRELAAAISKTLRQLRHQPGPGSDLTPNPEHADVVGAS
jgi:thioesterase domain-containing protein